MATALAPSIASGFSQSTGTPRSMKNKAMSGCVAGGVQMMTASQPAFSSSSGMSCSCDTPSFRRRPSRPRANIGDAGPLSHRAVFDRLDVRLRDRSRADQSHLRHLAFLAARSEARMLGLDRSGDEVDMRLGEALVPRQNQHVS